jgi:hypothetical protein
MVGKRGRDAIGGIGVPARRGFAGGLHAAAPLAGHWCAPEGRGARHPIEPGRLDRQSRTLAMGMHTLAKC